MGLYDEPPDPPCLYCGRVELVDIEQDAEGQYHAACPYHLEQLRREIAEDGRPNPTRTGYALAA